MKRIELPINKIAKLYERGWSITKLAKKYYVSYWTMWNRLEDLGIIRKLHRNILSPKEIEYQVKVVGMTYNQIADINGVSKSTIIRKTKRLKITHRGRNSKINRYTVLGVHYLRGEKMKIHEIAKTYGISKRTVATLLKKDATPIINKLKERDENTSWNK